MGEVTVKLMVNERLKTKQNLYIYGSGHLLTG